MLSENIYLQLRKNISYVPFYVLKSNLRLGIFLMYLIYKNKNIEQNAANVQARTRSTDLL